MEIEAAVDRIKEAVGPRGWVADPGEEEPYLVEARRLYRGATRLVVRPASTAEVAAVVRICAEARLPIVPQGGNTGLVGGGVPPQDGHNIVLALGRMNRIRAIDPVNFTMTVEAGCILAHLQQAAAEVDRLFPLSLGAEGSCQIGGNLSTNAGGIAVLRYGNTRELTLGLEVVLPDGRVWDGLRGLRKDNTGYDLKQLFIGGEGTLGIITAATVKLFPKPRETETAFLGLGRVEDVMDLLRRARAATADQLTAFELIPRAALDLALAHIPGTIDPLASAPSLVRAARNVVEPDRERHPRAFGTAARRRRSTQGLVADGVIAESGAQAKELWRIREAIVEAQLYSGSIKHDVSVPVSRVAEFIIRATHAVTRAAARHPADGLRPCRRRQHPLQPDPARRRRHRGLSGALAGVQRHRPRASCASSRLDQRRARRRPDEARRDHPLQIADRDRADAPRQARPRPRQRHEPGEAHQHLTSARPHRGGSGPSAFNHGERSAQDSRHCCWPTA